MKKQKKIKDEEVKIVYGEPLPAIISISTSAEATVIKGEKELISEVSKKYFMSKQSQHVNEVSTISAGIAPYYIDGLGNLIYKCGATEGKISEPYTKNVKLNAYTLQLVDIINYVQNLNGFVSPRMFISYKLMLELTGRKDIKRAREALKDMADNLFRVVFTVKRKYPREQIIKFNIVQTTILDLDVNNFTRRGGLEIRLNEDYFNMLKQAKPAPMHKDYFRLDPRYNANTITIYKKLANHKAMNIGKPNENICTVNTLLKATGLPSKEEVDNSGRQIYQRIIEPFFNALEKINGIDWHIVHADNTPYSDYDFNPSKNMAGDTITKTGVTYEEFINSKVIVDWKDYPNEKELRDKIKERKNKINKKLENKIINATVQKKLSQNKNL